MRDGVTELVELDVALQPVRRLDIRGWTVEWPGGEGWIGGIGPLTVVGRDLILVVPTMSDGSVVYAVTKIVEDDWQATEPWAPDRPGRSIRGLPLPGIRLQAERFFGLSEPLMASVGHRAYLLTFLEEELALFELTPSPRRLEAFPAGFSRSPPMPASEGREGTAANYALLESSKLPRGLYSRGAFLYLLTREPAPEGTRWRLHQIDPAADRLMHSMTLPTRANHIFLVPGAERWAIVEKGPVVAAGQQAIPSAVLVPSAWIENPESERLDDPLACTPVAPALAGPAAALESPPEPVHLDP